VGTRAPQQPYQGELELVASRFHFDSAPRDCHAAMKLAMVDIGSNLRFDHV
jgi:hypothetical protein